MMPAIKAILFIIIQSTTLSFATQCKTSLQDLLRQTLQDSVTENESKAIVKAIKAQTEKEVRKNKIPMKDYLKAVDEAGRIDPVVRKINAMFEGEHFTFAIDQSPDSRMGILKKGFLNQHQTHTSAGVLDPDKRNFIEANYLRNDPAIYEKVSKELKPKSMYLIPEPSTGIKVSHTHYLTDLMSGELIGDTWILDLKKIKEHTVFVAGDSLDRAFYEADLLDDWKGYTLNYSRRFKGKVVSEQLLPLDWIKTTTPYYYEQVKNSNELRYVDPEKFKAYYYAQKEAHGVMPTWLETLSNTSRPEFDEAFYEKFPMLKRFDENMMIRPFGNYTEGLYFGKLTPEKIKAMIFRGRQPSIEETTELKRLGIEIIDGRNPNQKIHS